jgi:hypothetical protein
VAQDSSGRVDCRNPISHEFEPEGIASDMSLNSNSKVFVHAAVPSMISETVLVLVVGLPEPVSEDPLELLLLVLLVMRLLPESVALLAFLRRMNR